MRCTDVARELVTPTEGLDAAELARHLASCPRCTAQAAEARNFDRVWNATRPVEPPAETWDRLWTEVSAASKASPIVFSLPTKPRRRWLVPVLSAALVGQAAAALIAVGLVWNRHPVAPETPSAPVAQIVFELEAGQTLFLELDERGDRVICRPQFVNTAELVAFDGEDGSDQDDLLVLNVMEGMD